MGSKRSSEEEAGEVISVLGVLIHDLGGQIILDRERVRHVTAKLSALRMGIKVIHPSGTSQDGYVVRLEQIPPEECETAADDE